MGRPLGHIPIGFVLTLEKLPSRDDDGIRVSDFGEVGRWLEEAGFIERVDERTIRLPHMMAEDPPIQLQYKQRRATAKGV